MARAEEFIDESPREKHCAKIFSGAPENFCAEQESFAVRELFRRKKTGTSGFCVDILALSPCFLSPRRSQRGEAATEGTKKFNRKERKVRKEKKTPNLASWRENNPKTL